MQKLYQDPNNFNEIFGGEIYCSSNYIELELEIHKKIIENLSIEENKNKISVNRIWKKNNKTFVICLVDDFSTCSTIGLPVQSLFDNDTIVITDNVVSKKTDYQILNLPKSFAGIYSYKPTQINFDPKRLINFPINRMDLLRVAILLDFLTKTDNLYFNFNCMTYNKNETFETNFQELGPEIKDRYRTKFNEVKDKMPMKNHSIEFEKTMYSAYVNAIVETYSGPDIIALSEKTFRALQTPSPWTLYSGTGTVNYLKSLEFDVLDDIVDHEYNNLITEDVLGPDGRACSFVDSTLQTAKKLSGMSKDWLALRCMQAATHNQNLLKSLKNRWPGDFSQWCDDNKKHVA